MSGGDAASRMKSERPVRRLQTACWLAAFLTSFACSAVGAETNSLPVTANPLQREGAGALVEAVAAVGAVTSSVPLKNASTGVDEQSLRSYLEVQAKLHSTLLAIEQARQEAGAASASNATLLADRLHQLESALASQRARERDAADQSGRTLLIAAGGFAGLGVLALGLVILFQMRGMTRLAEIATALPTARVLAAGHHVPALGSGDTTMPLLTAAHGEADAARLLGVIDRLERRIQELEHTAQGAPKTSESVKVTAKERESGAVKLIERAKLLEKSQRHTEALACCDEALTIEPTLTQAWLVKAAQLQALGRESEAVRCYESALQQLTSGPETAS